MPKGLSIQQRLMRERSRALAILLLTRRPGVSVEDVSADIGMDLLARVSDDTHGGLRQFGVELRQAMDDVTVQEANQKLRRSLREHHEYGPFPYPMVLFFFTMQTDGAWYTWSAEPVVAPDGRAELTLADRPDCRPLDNAAVAEIIDRVNHWYDAKYQPAVAG